MLRGIVKSRVLSRAEEEVSVVITLLRQAYPSICRSGQECKRDMHIPGQIFKHYDSRYLIA